MTFTITRERPRSGFRLCVTGDLDISTARQLHCAITDALGINARSLLVDFSATTFCDCAGITALLAGRRAAATDDVSYQMINPTGSSLETLQILDLHRPLTTRSS